MQPVESKCHLWRASVTCRDGHCHIKGSKVSDPQEGQSFLYAGLRGMAGPSLVQVQMDLKKEGDSGNQKGNSQKGKL